jgi:hypothetical protein
MSGAPGWIDFKLFAFRFLRPRSAIIHRTVRWVTGLSGVPAEQRLPSTTVDSNGRLQREQCADSSRRVRAVLEGAPDSEELLSGVTPDCPVPIDSSLSPMVVLVVGAINTPTTSIQGIQVSSILHLIQEL